MIFLEKERNYVSIIITVVSNTNAFVPQKAIFFGYFMSVSQGFHQVFIRFVCCFKINTLSTFFCSNQIIAKDHVFSK